jgi:hypothetical protein
LQGLVPNRRIVRGGGERVHGLRLVTGSLRSVCVCWCVRELGEWRSGRWRQQRWHWRFLLDNPRLVRREHRQRRARSRDEVGLRRLRQPDRHARECGRRRVASTPRRSFCTVAPTALGCRRGSLPVHKVRQQWCRHRRSELGDRAVDTSQADAVEHLVSGSFRQMP